MPTEWKTGPDMELRLIIAYVMIALMVAGIGATIYVVRKKNKALRGGY